MMSLTRFSACIGVAAALLVVAGCDYNVDKMAHVKMVTASHTVVFDGGRKQLPRAEYEALDAFVKSVPVSAVAYVGLEADDSNPWAVAHAKQLKAYLVKQGVDRKTIHLQPVAGGDGTTIVLNVGYAVGVPPQPCPDWSKRSSGTYNTTTGSNFGCAYYNNLIVQMANPEDFESAQGQEPVIDAERDSVFIKSYRAPSPGASAGSSASSSSASTSSGSGAR